MLKIESYLRGACKVAVSPSADTDSPAAWRDSEGNPWKPGDLTPNGSVVSFTPGQFVTHGVVLVEPDRLRLAESLGWELDEKQTAKLQSPGYTTNLIAIRR